ncbi:sulfatase family protein [Rhodopirellula sp. P2]|uniref:sulfatase family protein n=1 Tax=Rhodopirellula sp. P2 TaxID=2127060 RepID=UPI002368A1BD|nr:sulfatase-like hydrolase/transferase [Rhodopirellula sp. P2]WDQ15447.1 sulfatase-like hydrolase/transferase [Rhodopirellula sp. P2]
MGWLKTFVPGFITLAVLCSVATAAEKPNVVLILVDDLGYGDLSSFGADDLHTPHIDQLMSRGMRFDQFYANCTVCSPTRASLLTGCYPDRVGVPGVIRQQKRNSWGYLDPNATTLPQLLKTVGYHTGMVGKWHLGFETPNIPNARGFDFFHGFLGDMMDDYWSHLRGGKNWMRRNQEVIAPEGHATDLFTQWSIDYIQERSRQDQPFFLYLAYNAPHFPIQPPEDWLTQVKAREPQLSAARAANVAFIEHLDDGIGKVVASIEAAGIEDNTIILFSSDNGGSIPHAQSNGQLRGGKQDHWEGGIRVPTCVVWPGKIPPQRSNAIGMTMDFLPTLCEIAGAKVRFPIDGRSLTDIWLRGGSGDPERTLVWVRREGNDRYQGRAYYAIRKGPWKLQQSSPFEPMVLVNLDHDPLEKAPQPASNAIARGLREELMLHLQRAGAVPWQP